MASIAVDAGLVLVVSIADGFFNRRAVAAVQRQGDLMEVAHHQQLRGALSCDALYTRCIDGVWSFRLRVTNLRGAVRHARLWARAENGIAGERIELVVLGEGKRRKVNVAVPVSLWSTGRGWSVYLVWLRAFGFDTGVRGSSIGMA
jgi:hypothetical protein